MHFEMHLAQLQHQAALRPVGGRGEEAADRPVGHAAKLAKRKWPRKSFLGMQLYTVLGAVAQQVAQQVMSCKRTRSVSAVNCFASQAWVFAVGPAALWHTRCCREGR